VHTRWIGFGEIEIEGERYTHDVVVDAGRVTKRVKKPSTDERIPWGGSRLIVGTGAYGGLPITPDVWEDAARRGVEIVAVPTDEALRLLREIEAEDVRAVLHVTC
jgi:hypothetical protein